VSVQTLQDNGIDIVGESASEVALMNRGERVPIQVTGSDPLDVDSNIRFIADALDTLYTNTNVYTLSLDASLAQRILPDAREPIGDAATSYLKRHRVESQAKYSFTSPDKNDPWYSHRIVAIGKPASEVVQLNLPNVAVGGNTGSTKAKLKVTAWGSIDQPGVAKDHNMRVLFNGRDVAGKKFDGLTSAQVETELASVNEGGNSVTVMLPMDTGYAFDAVNLDEVVVDYPSQFVAEEGRITYQSTFGKFRLKGFSALDLPNREADLVVMREDASGTHVMTNNGVRCNNRACRVETAGTGKVARYYVSSRGALHAPEISALPLDQDITSGHANYLIISHLRT